MIKRLISLITIAVIISSIFVGRAVQAASKAYTSQRLGGATRIDTCLQIANAYININGSKVNNVVLATAEDFPDALTGSALAAKVDAPILLVEPRKSDSQAVLDFIKANLNAGGGIYILGGPGAVTPEIEQAIRDMGFNNITRLGGATREDTAQLIDNKVAAAQGTPVFIATENDFPDALSASSVAAIKGYPVTLTQKDTLPQTTIDVLNSLKPSQIFVVGGNGVVADNVITQIKSLTGLGDSSIERLWGADRYATSLAVAQRFNLNGSNALIATGENFPDALSGSMLAAKYNAPIVLVNEDISRQHAYLDSTSVTNLVFLGGTGVVSDVVLDALSNNIPDSYKTTPLGEFISKIKDSVMESYKKYGIFASISFAQAVLESGTGSSVLAIKYNNLFGIKAHNWSGRTAELPTIEYYNGTEFEIIDTFRVYDSWGDSVIDHAKFLKDNSRYTDFGVFSAKNYIVQANALQAAGYATDPDYASKLIAIIKENNLDKYD